MSRLTWKQLQACLRPFAVDRSALSPSWLCTAPKLNIMAAFSKWIFCCDAFLAVLNASHHVKVTLLTCSRSVLIGNRDSMTVSARKYLESTGVIVDEKGYRFWNH